MKKSDVDFSFEVESFQRVSSESGVLVDAEFKQRPMSLSSVCMNLLISFIWPLKNLTWTCFYAFEVESSQRDSSGSGVFAGCRVQAGLCLCPHC